MIHNPVANFAQQSLCTTKYEKLRAYSPNVYTVSVTIMLDLAKGYKIVPICNAGQKANLPIASATYRSSNTHIMVENKLDHTFRKDTIFRV